MSKYNPENIGTVSSGDAAQDAADVEQFIKSSMLLDEGLCPNGCGPRLKGMPPETEGYDGGSHCPVCGFVCNMDLP